MAAELAIERAWQVWASSNLLRGASRDEVTGALIAKGAPAEMASRLVDEILASPVFEAAHGLGVTVRRSARVTELLRSVAREAGHEWHVERAEFPGIDAFYRRYVATNQPVIFTDLVTTWPALSRWTPALLAERFGDLEVSITAGRDADPDQEFHHERHVTKIAFHEFLAQIERIGESDDVYMSARDRNLDVVLASLLEDISPPEGLLDGDRLCGASALWIGPRGTVTPLHHDTSSILFCQVYGRKRFVLVPPWELDVNEGARGMYAGVDPEHPDRQRFPWFDDALIETVDLAPGDALFLPVGWWHHVRALDVSISLALNNLITSNRFEGYLPGIE